MIYECQFRGMSGRKPGKTATPKNRPLNPNLGKYAVASLRSHRTARLSLRGLLQNLRRKSTQSTAGHRRALHALRGRQPAVAGLLKTFPQIW